MTMNHGGTMNHERDIEPTKKMRRSTALGPTLAQDAPTSPAAQPISLPHRERSLGSSEFDRNLKASNFKLVASVSGNGKSLYQDMLGQSSTNIYCTH